MRRVILILIMSIIVLKVGYADISISKAYISVNLINERPVISEIFFEPSTVYEDTDIECVGVVKNENPDILLFKQKWFVNGEFVNGNKILEHKYFKPGDMITCELIADDKVQDSEAVKDSIKAIKSPINLKFQKEVLGLIGIETNTNEIEKLSENGMASITGFVVSEIKKDAEPFKLRLLILALGIVLLVSVNILFRTMAKKDIKYPT